MTTLEDLESGMDAECMAILGDSITFRPAGGSALAIKAYVNFEDMARSLDGTQAIEQNITVQVRKVDLPAKPRAQDRITLGKVAGKIYQPVNVGQDISGTHWNFELRQVNA